MEERQAHYGATGVTPNVGDYSRGTDMLHVDANIDNINSEWEPSVQAEVSQWLGAIAGLGENATPGDKVVAKYLEDGIAYVDNNDLTPAEANEYMAAVLESAEVYSEEEDTKQKVGAEAVDKTLSNVA